jgi:hypothetical protein
MDSTQNEARKRALRSTYTNTPQFGLVLGAGVTADSHVPTYEELALRLLERASSEEAFTGSQGWARAFAKHQRALRKEKRKTVPPDEVVQFVRTHLGQDKKLLRKLVKELLYEHTAAAAPRRSVGRGAFEENTTLDAILTFCAAQPNTVLAPASKYKIGANIRIGGILTTNYDNLLEGAFHTKYRRNLLKPVGRPSSEEFEQDRRVIPVYHVHGYVGYRDRVGSQGGPKTPDVVIAEDDYFQVFYDPLGFGNYVAMSFLRRFPCLFIGSGMTDKNLRRYLFHLARDAGTSTPHQRKFAIVKATGDSKDEVTDKVLLSYGVETIWIKEFGEIRDILAKMYTAVGGVTEKDWESVAGFRWGEKG